VKQRLQRFLAAAGLGSRRAGEELIRQGRVTVDGRVAELGDTVDPAEQSVAVDGRPVQSQAPEYWLLNKATGVVTTVSDPQGRPTVVQQVPARGRVFPVGRLDRETTGVLVLTNDGELANRLIHPRFGVRKEYRVVAAGAVSDEEVARLAAGIELQEGRTAPAEVRVTSRKKGETELVISIHEGRNRQVRRMLEAVGHSVLRLHRARFDGLSDAGLPLGQARLLSAQEVALLRRAGGLS